MAKRLSEKELKNIVKSFTEGKTIHELAQSYDCAELTITRNLKRKIGEENYKQLFDQNKRIKKAFEIKDVKISYEENKDINRKFLNESHEKENLVEETLPFTPFIEITPLNCEIEDTIQKELSSISIADIEFPKTVFMIVDKKIELETKYLREYPEWQFLSPNEQNRKTIAIYDDLKIAKRFCNKEQKVIKVPNTEVFKIVAPLLLNRGISRIVSSDKLIAL